jgi:hypothetical protein
MKMTLAQVGFPSPAKCVPNRDVRFANCGLAYERFSYEAKIGYVKLNIPMPCPPRGTVPVKTGAWFYELVSSQHARFAFGEGCDCASYVGH